MHNIRCDFLRTGTRLGHEVYRPMLHLNKTFHLHGKQRDHAAAYVCFEYRKKRNFKSTNARSNLMQENSHLFFNRVTVTVSENHNFRFVTSCVCFHPIQSTICLCI